MSWRAVAQAKVQLGQSMRFLGQQAIQLHGGIGMTEEYVGSHYFKRLTTMEMQYGDTMHHLGEVSARMLETAGAARGAAPCPASATQNDNVTIGISVDCGNTLAAVATYTLMGMTNPTSRRAADPRRGGRDERQIEFERINTLYTIAQPTLIGGIAFSALIGLLLAHCVPQPLLATWLALKIALLTARIVDGRLFLRDRHRSLRLVIWKGRFFIGTIAGRVHVGLR